MSMLHMLANWCPSCHLLELQYYVSFKLDYCKCIFTQLFCYRARFVKALVDSVKYSILWLDCLGSGRIRAGTFPHQEKLTTTSASFNLLHVQLHTQPHTRILEYTKCVGSRDMYMYKTTSLLISLNHFMLRGCFWRRS